MIVLGGGLSLQGEDLLMPVRGHLAALGLTRMPVVSSVLGVDAQLHGAIVAALDLRKLRRTSPAAAIDLQRLADD
jgi:hypothetical protein